MPKIHIKIFKKDNDVANKKLMISLVSDPILFLVNIMQGR